MNFLSLDENNRIIGIRSGSYSIDEKTSSEYVYEKGHVNSEHLNALYDPITETITFDEVYEEIKNSHNPQKNEQIGPLDPSTIRPAIRRVLNAKAIEMGFTDIDVGANSNPTLLAWRRSIWSWVNQQNMANYSTGDDLVAKMPTYESVTANT
jgi:hypothetical protein